MGEVMSGIMVRPVRYPTLRFGDIVTPVVIQFVRHAVLKAGAYEGNAV
jgi:hypothetical protein